ncbi:unnamed protein product [[Actinomadura] parvosata subsp. kistnae]|uniref:hypothetical protein n=1 Tax=[Actinomadura] parvosata TaxID=1955412 RepID=UPI000D2EA38C|nr:hypothetical protein [Nonomuraea sp. ATCC 55076]SPL99987.1 unnamed protein product [Actinomadura parvosata subsp. kistnae]
MADSVSYDVERSRGVVNLHLASAPTASNKVPAFRTSRGSPAKTPFIAYEHTVHPVQLLRRLANPQQIHIVNQWLSLTSP